MTAVLLPVVYEGQQVFFLCGPACINMVLSRWGKQHSATDVWNEVQANTMGGRPNGAPLDAGSFPNQQCDLCSSELAPNGTTVNTYSCWYTSPEAMAATITASAPLPARLDFIVNFDDAIRRLAASIATFDTPAVFTTAPGLHWLVAYGYEYEKVAPVGPSSIDWNGQHITGIYTYNPSTPPSLTMVTPRGFGGLMMAINCRGLPRTYPVVGGGLAVGAISKLTIYVLAALRRSKWLVPERFLTKFKSWQRPAPPPGPRP